ncbi:hypothetical protein SERLA73DRAFT_137641 [Serpula lacrymans var. lacrymans S7.3]|uniref:Uncharacterized protein n=2 Tax=Serpula lacrymans var. lacrymans TaxID=341189 RepID=F8PX08_SERL3|nr:hypothetical protein SERLA73DRAFT_137641 [Serpula lacrymans var. lacrymans S7.3]
MSLRERGPEYDPHGRSTTEKIMLPPIQPLAQPRNGGQNSYALPPISALEDLRGISSHDSAAVLRRLKMDDDVKVEDGESTDEQQWARQRSLSSSHHKY